MYNLILGCRRRGSPRTLIPYATLSTIFRVSAKLASARMETALKLVPGTLLSDLRQTRV